MSSRTGGYVPSEGHARRSRADDYHASKSHHHRHREPEPDYGYDAHLGNGYSRSPGSSSAYPDDDRRVDHYSYRKEEQSRRYLDSPEPVRRVMDSYRDESRRRSYAAEEEERRPHRGEESREDHLRRQSPRSHDNAWKSSQDTDFDRFHPQRSERESKYRDGKYAKPRQHSLEREKRHSNGYYGDHDEHRDEYERRRVHSPSPRQTSDHHRSNHYSAGQRADRSGREGDTARREASRDSWEGATANLGTREQNGKGKARAEPMPMEDDAFERLSSKKAEKPIRREPKENGQSRDRDYDRDRRREEERHQGKQRERVSDRDRDWRREENDSERRKRDRERERERDREREQERERGRDSNRHTERDTRREDEKRSLSTRREGRSRASEPSANGTDCRAPSRQSSVRGDPDRASSRNGLHPNSPRLDVDSPSTRASLKPPPPPEGMPATPPPPPPSPPPLSFTGVKLPHELLMPGNEAFLPKNKSGKSVLPFRVTYDPALDKAKKGKEVLRTAEISETCQDPRKKGVHRRVRREMRIFRWNWDPHSTKAKPPPPPRAILVTQLSALTTLVQLKQHFRGFGRIEDAELYHDKQSGASLGIFYLKFCQDYDEDLRAKEGLQEGQGQRGDLVAKETVERVNGTRVRDDVVRVVLDDDERTAFTRAYREEMGRRYAPKPAVADSAAPAKDDAIDRAPSSSAITPVREANMPPPIAPKGPPPSAPRGPRATFGPTAGATPPPLRAGYPSAATSRGHVLVSARSPFVPSSPATGVSHGSASPGSVVPLRDGQLRQAVRSSDGIAPTPADSIEGEDLNVLTIVAQNYYPYLFVSKEGAPSTVSIKSLWVRYEPYRLRSTYEGNFGWYLTFGRSDGAEHSLRFLGTRMHGHDLTVEVRDQQSLRKKLAGKTFDASTAASATLSGNVTVTVSPKKAAAAKRPAKTAWSEEELLRDARLLLLRELGESFMRDIKTRIIKPFLSDFLRPTSAGGHAINAPTRVVLDDAEDEESEADEEEERQEELQEEAVAEDDITMEDREDGEEDMMAETAKGKEEEVKVKLHKGKRGKKAKKAQDLVEVVQVDVPATESVDGTTITTVRVKSKKPGKQQRQRSPSPDPFALGIAEDEEDVYYVKVALQKMHEGSSALEVNEEGVAAVEAFESMEALLGANGLPRHASGSARTEGFYRIPPAEKALHLPDRNRAVVDPASAVGLASARDNRADSRRFVQGIEQHKKETATDTDILKFNQLRSRKKQLKFAKSPIHDWGLYAMELIPAGDMVIEYVGEIVRQQIADQREKMYERQGNFSTYLFRVDDDVVVDATKKGNIARLMNHCCTPNCNAKILTLNGEKRIVLYAKNTILPGQELTYDYKFQATGDEEDAIACLCGSPGCRRFL